MITPITIFANIRNQVTGKRERVIVLPEMLDLFDPERFIIGFYIEADDKCVTIPGTEFHHIADEWLAQFELAS